MLLLLSVTAAALRGYVPAPAVHYTPPPWIVSGGGDMAGAMLHPVTGVWHVMPLSEVGWAHISSSDLVSWKYYGNGTVQPAQGGGPAFESGGMLFDAQRNVTVAFADSPTAASVSRDPDLGFGSFEKPTTLYSTIDPLNDGLGRSTLNSSQRTDVVGCWDPNIWWDERSSLFYAANACGHCDPGDTPREQGSHIDCAGGEGLQVY